MKLVLLHGPAINASRIKLKAIRDQFPNEQVMVLPEGELTSTILTNLQSNSLFEGDRLLIAENPAEDFTDYPSMLVNCQLVLWFDHQIPEKKPILEWFKKNGQVFYFPEEKETSVFPLLDCLAAADQKAFLQIKKLKSEGYDIFYFINMTYYLLRNLTVNPKRAPQFVLDKLARQRKSFNQEKISRLYLRTLEIEFKLKSGLLEKDQAEFLLVNQFIDESLRPGN